MNDFRWWPYPLAALVPEAWLGVSLVFAPGWANGWPWGLPMHLVWPCGMAMVVSVMFMTLAAGAGAASCSVLAGRVGLRRSRAVYRSWLVGCAFLAAGAEVAIARGLMAEAIQMWAGGYP